ncbi:UNVERIFIED_CONTAM: CASP-like protein 2A1 [Sesamum latifolium]|uniref:CASP-like protein n=1 Tax=Sesamum latifolium TaxID=2727402 RepID=A0AAW2TR13_9LAMI
MGKHGAVPATSAAEMGGDESGSSTMRTAETLLRVLPMALCVAALVIMLKDSQTNDYGSLSYSDLGAFRFVFGACKRRLRRLFPSLRRGRGGAPPLHHVRAWAFFLLDQLLTYIILAAGAISTEVVYLAYKGDASITWSRTCGSFEGFCRKATTSIAITFVVTLCYAALSLISSYRLFSKYDAPVAYSNKGIEVTTFTS